MAVRECNMCLHDPLRETREEGRGGRTSTTYFGVLKDELNGLGDLGSDT